MGNGVIYHSGAGCGKTYGLCKMAQEASDPIILSFTNNAIQNVKSVLCDEYNNYELAKKCYTFDIFFVIITGVTYPVCNAKQYLWTNIL